MNASPTSVSYDVVIVGGAIYGSSVAWFLTEDPDFDGSVLVIERDPTYEFASTSHTNSCMRQQFSNPTNIQLSRFAADFVKNFRARTGDDQAPELALRSYGYMYMAADEAGAGRLREAQALQASLGAGTRHLTAERIAAEYPFYNLDGVVAANHNPVDEGYFDGAGLFDWWRRSAKERGVEFIANEAVAMKKNAAGDRIEAVTLRTGESVACGVVVNASGPRAVLTSRMAGIEIPVEPRKRHTFIFDAERPISPDAPLTIDPSGVHVRTDGRYYLAGCPPDDDIAVDYDDFIEDHSIWEEKAWPAIAHRIPQFEAVRLVNSWVGHYAFNTFDQNAIVGPHDEVGNFLFVNGFSGHGLQQSPGIGRGVAEWITHGEYRALDLSPFAFGRIARGEPFVETAVI